MVARLRAAGCVFAEDEAHVLVEAATCPADLARMVAERVAGRPLEHVVGWAEFGGRRIAVAPGVFVPRRRTELLASLARSRLGDGGVLVDLCCGSGAVAVAAAADLPGVVVHAADVDPAAVEVAQANVGPLGGTVWLGDLFDALPRALRGSIDVVTANVPYVPSSEIALMPVEARSHEPRLALDGGADGLTILRTVATAAPDWLRIGGALIIETSRAQTGAAGAALTAAGLRAELVADESRDALAVVGTRRS